VPANAVVRNGPGLVTGGAPVPLGPDGESVGMKVSAVSTTTSVEDTAKDEIIADLRKQLREASQQRPACRTLTQFLVSDEGAKCKVYVEVGVDLLERKEEVKGGVAVIEGAVSATFSGKTCVLRITTPKLDGTIGELRAVTLVGQADIVPDKCSCKVDRAKGRVTVTFKKKDELKKWTNVTAQAP